MVWIRTKTLLINTDNIQAIEMRNAGTSEDEFEIVVLVNSPYGTLNDFSSDFLIIYMGTKKECEEKLKKIEEAVINGCLYLELTD